MRIVGQEQIADVFGVAPKTIVEWQALGFPVAVTGGPGVPSEYDTEVCIAWKLDRELRKVRTESSADRLNRVKADQIEMENAERRGLLIPADAIEPKMKAAALLAREMFLDKPASLARAVQGKPAEENEELIRSVFEDFLRRFSRWQDADVIEDEEEGGSD